MQPDRTRHFSADQAIRILGRHPLRCQRGLQFPTSHDAKLMIPEDKATPIDRLLLRAAQVAVEQHNPRRADALFLEHLALERADPVALADYGNFCLRTGRHESACYLLSKASELIPGNADLLSQLGYARLETEDREGAENSFRSAIAIDPSDAAANYGLGSCHQQAGAWPEAIAAFERALVAEPNELPILLDLAIACHRTGDDKKAAIHFERAERLAPNDPAMLLEYGKFLRDTGQFAQAMQKLDRCARDHPNDPAVTLETARCLRAIGDYARAIQLLDKLGTISPGMPECHEEYGNCFELLQDIAMRDWHWGRAVEQWLRKAEYAVAQPLLLKMLDARPGDAPTRVFLGIWHARQRQFESAEAAYIKAIELDPACVEAHANLAGMYEQTNRIPQAKAIAESGLALENVRHPQMRSFHFSLLLTACRVARRQERYPDGMQCLDQIALLSPTGAELQQAGFERGKLLDLLGDESGAIAAFNDANAAARMPWAKAHPGANVYLRDLENLRGLVGSGWLKTWRPLDAPESGVEPVFLVGFPRSGTTLLNQVLYCHSALQTAEEKPLVDAMLNGVRSMPSGYPSAIADFDRFDAAYLRARYFKAAAQHGVSDPSRLLVDKFPLHANLAGLIHRVFPHARFIFTVRHPCDVVLSCFMQDFQSNDAMANFFTLADTVKLYTLTMDLWQAYREQLSLDVHTVRYEDIVDDFDARVHALCDFLRVPWEDSLRQFATKALDRGKINTPSYEQVSKPIYRAARYRWERYHTHLEPFLPALQPYIDRFGYSDATRST
jgi:tetratricopeptide (TPR) repeat protein